jgi:hypothetical protein
MQNACRAPILIDQDWAIGFWQLVASHCLKLPANGPVIRTAASSCGYDHAAPSAASLKITCDITPPCCTLDNRHSGSSAQHAPQYLSIAANHNGLLLLAVGSLFY